MHWATDDNGNLYFADYTDAFGKIDRQLSESLYAMSEMGCKYDKPCTFADIVQLFEDLKTEEKYGGFDDGEFTQYKTVFDFIRDSLPEVISVLVPLSESDKAIKAIEKVCKHNGWTQPNKYTVEQMADELSKEYSGSVPEWLACGGTFYGLKSVLETYWDPDIGLYQALWGE